MRFVWLLVLTALTLIGCARTGPSASNLSVTPASGARGKVVSVNAGARFVVLNFPLGVMVAPERRLNVYRSGLKVGEIKVTGPQRDTHTVADIVTGECQVGDEVREN